MSTIIIRLQNLPLSAKAADIREFFGDLKIPKGSVNIVGGHLGDAFIGFASDEDARLAMLLDGRLLHNSKIRLMLSSKREMEQVISSAQIYGGGKPPQIAVVAQFGQNESTIQSPPDPSQKESVKLEVNSSLSTGFPFNSQQQPPPTFQQPTLLEQQTSFVGNDSWKKTPNLTNQTNIQQQQQTNTITRQIPQTNIFETSGGVGGNVLNNSNIPSFGQTQQQQTHQYQQLIQGFPQQIGQQVLPPPPSQQQQQQFRPNSQQPQQQPQPQFRPQFQTQQPRLFGNENNFYNSQIGTQQQQSSRFPGIQPQQNFYNTNCPPLQFGNPLVQQQQRPQFNQRGGGGGFSSQQQFGGGGGYRGPHSFGGGKRFPGGQQRSFDNDKGGFDRRRRSRSPLNDQRKRLNIPPNNVAIEPSGADTASTETRSEYGKGRFCVQLSNVPYKAAFNDINEYLSLARAVCIKVTRVYIPDKNYTDRWIVEFDNDENSKALIKYRGDIFGRTIRAERIPPRRADEQYAVAEPDERDLGRGRRRDIRRERSRSRSRNRDRSRSREVIRQRDRDSKDRPNSREGSGPRIRPNRRSSSPPIRKRSSSLERFQRREFNRDRDFNTSSRDDHRNRGGRDDFHHNNNNQYQQRRNSVIGRRAGNDNSNNNGGNEPVPLFGAFAFPSAQANQSVYNPKSGTIVQLGNKDIKPLPLRSFTGPPTQQQQSQFFPSTQTSSNNNNNGRFQQSQGWNQQQQHRNNNNNNLIETSSNSSILDQYNINNNFQNNNFRQQQHVGGGQHGHGGQHHQNNSNYSNNNFHINSRMMTGSNSLPLGTGGGGRQNYSSHQYQQSPPKSLSPIQEQQQQCSSSLDNSGSLLIIQEDNSSIDGKGNDSSNEMSSSLKIEKSNSLDHLPSMMTCTATSSSSLPYTLTLIPDQPPMDLLEPTNVSDEGGNE